MKKIALLGSGEHLKKHLQIYLKMENIQIVAICSLPATNLDGIQQLLGIKQYQNIHQLLNTHPQLDLLDFCLPSISPRNWIKEASKAKQNIAVVAPLMSTIAEANQITRSAKKNKTHLFITHTHRFSSTIARTKEITDSGILETKKKIELTYTPTFNPLHTYQYIDLLIFLAGIPTKHQTSQNQYTITHPHTTSTITHTPHPSQQTLTIHGTLGTIQLQPPSPKQANWGNLLLHLNNQLQRTITPPTIDPLKTELSWIAQTLHNPQLAIYNPPTEQLNTLKAFLPITKELL